MASERSWQHDPVTPFADFKEAASTVLRLLHREVGFGLWLLTRTEGDDWIVLDAEDHAYGVQAGDVFSWSDTFCSRMVEGMGPRAAPSSNEVPAYAEAPIGEQVPIRAYIGVPLERPDGRLFGTLCAIDPEPQSDAIRDQLPMVETYARLLATILHSDLARQEEARRAERAEIEADTDALTGVFNRRGWKRLRDAEDLRCARYGHPAGIVLIDINGLKRVNDGQGHEAGDRLLKRAAATIQNVVRRTDVVARLGGDEFAVLAVEEPPQEVDRLVLRLRQALSKAGVEAAIGGGSRHPKGSLETAELVADGKMYTEKRR